MEKWISKFREIKKEIPVVKIEKSQKQLEYESALSYILSKGFNIETYIKEGEGRGIAEITVLRNDKKFYDSLGRDRVKVVPVDNDLCKRISETVINLYLYLKSKEQ